MACWVDSPAPSWATNQVNPDPRPAKRIRASKSEWTDIHQAFAGACCVHCGLRHQSLHHILPRSHGGDDLAVNLAPLCGDGTRGCHGLLEGHASGWERVAASIRQYVISDPARLRYQERRAGEAFNNRYPCLPNTDPQFERDFRVLYPPLESRDLP